MTDLAGTIAQFIIPSDGIGNPNPIYADWAHGKFYGFNDNGSRVWNIDPSATQNPVLSVSPPPVPGTPPRVVTCDSVGNIIYQAGSSNSEILRRLSPTTLLQTASFGVDNSGIGGYPAALDACYSICCITCNGVPYAICKSLVSGFVYVVRTDNMTAAGGAFNIVVAQFGFLTMGPSGGDVAQAYLIDDPHGGGVPALNFYAVTITKGAENYSIGVWPTPNPNISGVVVGSITAASLGPYTSIQSVGLGWDPVTGLAIAEIATDFVNHFLLGIDTATAEVVWTLPISGYSMTLGNSRLSDAHLAYLGSGGGVQPIDAIQTGGGGSDTSQTVTNIHAGNGFPTLVDGVNELFIVNCSYNESGSLVVPVDGSTPSSFSGLAMLNVWPTDFPPPPPAASVGELWFGQTGGFIDLSVASNRRNFISPVGGAQFLGSDGAKPFGSTPPLYLSRAGVPSTFATNKGRGGAFVITGALADASDPPGSFESTTSYPGTSPGQGVVGDYLTGNLYAWNTANYTDDGTQRRWVRRWRALEKSSLDAKRFSVLVVTMQTGADVPNGANPQVMLRWSDDGGTTWSNPRIMAVGRLGQTAQTVKFNRLGMTQRYGGSNRIFELSSTDPFKVALLDADVEAS